MNDSQISRIGTNQTGIPYQDDPILHEDPPTGEATTKLRNKEQVIQEFVKNQNVFGELQKNLMSACSNRFADSSTDLQNRASQKNLFHNWDQLATEHDRITKEMAALKISSEKIIYDEEKVLNETYPWILKNPDCSRDNSDLILKIHRLTPDQCVDLFIKCQQFMHREFVIENQKLFTSEIESKYLLSPDIYHALATIAGKYDMSRMIYAARLAVEKMKPEQLSNEKIVNFFSEPGFLDFTLLHHHNVFLSAEHLLLKLNFNEFSKVMSIKNSDRLTVIDIYGGNAIKHFSNLKDKVIKASTEPAYSQYFVTIGKALYYQPNPQESDKKYQLTP